MNKVILIRILEINKQEQSRKEENSMELMEEQLIKNTNVSKKEYTDCTIFESKVSHHQGFNMELNILIPNCVLQDEPNKLERVLEKLKAIPIEPKEETSYYGYIYLENCYANAVSVGYISFDKSLTTMKANIDVLPF